MAQLDGTHREIFFELILDSLREIVAQGDRPFPCELKEETPLIGHGAILDSIGLVTLVIDIEQRIEEKFGWALTLANDRAMSQKNSPFRTVQALTDYVVSLTAAQTTNG